MELILEIIIYLLVVLGLITVCFTFFNKFTLIDTMLERDIKEESINTVATYYRERTEGSRLVINIRHKNISLEELEKVKQAIEFGNYNNINDIADKVNYLDSNKK